MDKKIKKFLWCSFIGVIIICAVMFTWLIVFMKKKTNASITEVSEFYLSEMNQQLQQKFQSIINLRMEQIDAILKSVPPDSDNDVDEILDKLIESAEIRDYTYLGFYTQDGSLEIIYGEKVEIVRTDDIIASLEKDGKFTERGYNESEEKILLLGKAAEYEMEDGRKSVALVAGLSMEYLNKALFLESKDTNLYSHIIDKNGEFVIRNSDVFRNNYFERINEKYETLNGKHAADYARELREAMEKGENYSAVASIEGEERNIYCSPLSDNSTWYLITVMPKGAFEHSITTLDRVRNGAMLGALAIIIFMVIIIFVSYFRLSRQQMLEISKAREEAVRANNAKSEFLASMSHDIRTPMNAIIGMTDIALNNKQDAQRIEECLTKVKLSSKHLIGLINDVLDMSKIESGKMTLNVNKFSLRETMDDIVNIMQPQVKERKQFFDIFIQNILFENVYGDGMRLNQVLLNLMSNAVKFTPEEGRIDIHVYQEESPKGKKYVRTHFVVEDTGIGMSKEFQKKIFETFTRAESENVQHVEGTGLGMAISKSIIDLMKGSIELQSELEKGSKFHITLDLEVADGQEEMRLPQWDILVIDDNEMLCKSAVSNLEELGVHAEWTLDGQKAVNMIEERHKNNNDYHFVLIDWKMPNMDGLSTIDEIKKRVGTKIPMFLISAYDWSDIEDEVKMRGTEIQGFISKPLFKSTLYSYLSRYTDSPEKVEEQPRTQQVDFGGKHVLLAEDIDLNWEIADEILSPYGLKLERAVNGKECVEKFEHSEKGYYDLILMDIRMPVMNGYDATKAIRALTRSDKDVPIIAMTADAFSDDVQICLDCGMNDHLAKPLDIQEVIRTLKKFL